MQTLHCKARKRPKMNQTTSHWFVFSSAHLRVAVRASLMDLVSASTLQQGSLPCHVVQCGLLVFFCLFVFLHCLLVTVQYISVDSNALATLLVDFMYNTALLNSDGILFVSLDVWFLVCLVVVFLV